MEKIPLEVGLYIASSISLQRDVAAMCLVSSHWLAAARPILYKKLELKYSTHAIRDTLRMLSMNKHVKSCIRDLYIHGGDIEPTEEILALWSTASSQLEGMHNVRFLSIRGLYFYPSSLTQLILRDIYATAPHLVKIRLLEGHRFGEVHLLVEDPELLQTAIPSMLKDIFVDYSNMPIQILMVGVLRNPSAITKLHLYSLGPAPHIVDILPTLRFPKLDTFKLSIYRSQTQTAKPLIDFLAAHPSIRTCLIASNYVLDIHAGTPKGILPNLTSLSASLAIIRDLSRLCACLPNLTSLGINNVGAGMNGIWEWDDEAAKQRYFLSIFEEVIERIHGLPRLRRFSLWRSEDYNFIVELLKQVSKTSPSIEQLSFFAQATPDWDYPPDVRHPVPEDTPDPYRISELKLKPDGKAEARLAQTSFLRVLKTFPKLRRLDFPAELVTRLDAYAYREEINTVRLIYIAMPGEEDDFIDPELHFGDSPEFRIIDEPDDTIWWMNEAY